MKNKHNPTPTKLKKWIWTSYLKTALLPLILVEFVFINIYFLSNNWSQREMTSFMTSEVNVELTHISNLESSDIQNQLLNISYMTQMYAKQTEEALAVSAEMSPEDAQRLAYSSDGAYYSTKDAAEGGAAIFYSGIMPVNEKEREKVARVLTRQQLMKDIQQSHPLIASIYLNTFDSLNIIYPYFDVIDQYSTNMNIPTFNFYYEADAQHNPKREVQWTDVYLDPAGHGWMISSIAPAYNGNFLEGVVGIDVTISIITDQILNMEVPWDGYAILVDKEGTILALPEQGEAEFGITELKDHSYSEAILQDTYKPENFNVSNIENFSSIAQNMLEGANGFSEMTLNNETKVVSWDTIGNTGWKLVLIIPQKNIYMRVDNLGTSLLKIGIFMICGLILFYCIFFFFLYRRSQNMSKNISQPLLVINEMVKSIGAGNYYPKQPVFNVLELQETSLNLGKAGEALGRTNENLLATQNMLKNQEAYLQALVNSVGDVIMEVDGNGIFSSVRASDSSNLAKNYDSGAGNSISTILSKEAASKHLEIIKRVLKTGVVETTEYELETSRGMRWFQARIASISNETNTVAISSHDITDRIELEQSIKIAWFEANKANIAKSQFLSSISHELRTPLNAVLGFAQVLKIDPVESLTVSQKESVDAITKAGEYLLKLINEVLDLVKIESGKIDIKIENVHLFTVINETLNIISSLAEEHGIAILSTDKEHSNIYVKADNMRLKQVFINLFSNAIKYNRKNGSVTYYCELSGDKVIFHIVDTGVGIPKGELDNIFEPFHRIKTTKNTVEGTGIGLSLVTQLLDLMEGKVRVESKEGEGSHFYVELPIAEDEDADISFSKDETIEIGKENKLERKVLYVEDNIVNFTLVERILSFIPGIRVISALSAEIGIPLAREHQPSIILLDINLPGMDGYEMLKELQLYEETRSIPVIAISAYAMKEDINRALKSGFRDYITKPINVPLFIEKLNKLLKEK